MKDNNPNVLAVETNHSSYLIDLHKIKKQAKRLLEIEQKFPEVKIKNLSEAYEIISQIYGWKDWHTFQQYLNKAKSLPLKNTSIVKLTEFDNGINLQAITNLKLPTTWQEKKCFLKASDGDKDNKQHIITMDNLGISLVYGKPGSGKSMLIHNANLAFCLMAKEIPRLSIVDIGQSSSGLISSIKENLPDDKKHLVINHKLRLTQDNSINIFDTQLGSRYPNFYEKTFLLNFLSHLITQDQSVDYANYDNNSILPLIKNIIEEIYKRKSDCYEPNHYLSGLCLSVDKKIHDCGLFIDKKTTWWEIVDQLFNKGCIKEATLAQRYAVPLLADVIKTVQQEEFKNKYSENSEKSIKQFIKLMASAVEAFPNLSQPTMLDFSEAKIISIDLDETICTNLFSNEKMIETMYMVTKNLICKDLFLNYEILEEMATSKDYTFSKTIPFEKYKFFHKKRIEQIIQTPKKICCDELHRVYQSRAFKNQLVFDLDEAKKLHISTILASQALESFNQLTVKKANNIFILSGGDQISCQKIANIFMLSTPQEIELLTDKISGPSFHVGQDFVLKSITHKGQYTNLINFNPSKQEIWTLTTSVLEMQLRNKLSKKLGWNRAIELLAEKHPHGIKGYLEKSSERIKYDQSMTFALEQIYQELLVVD